MDTSPFRFRAMAAGLSPMARAVMWRTARPGRPAHPGIRGGVIADHSDPSGAGLGDRGVLRATESLSATRQRAAGRRRRSDQREAG